MAAHARKVLDVAQLGDATTVKFVDHMIMDEQTIKLIGDELFGLVEAQGRRDITLDFTGVEYLASSILGKFLSLKRKVDAASGKLTLCHLDPQLRKIFEISKLDTFFGIAPA